MQIDHGRFLTFFSIGLVKVSRDMFHPGPDTSWFSPAPDAPCLRPGRHGDASLRCIMGCGRLTPRPCSSAFRFQIANCHTRLAMKLILGFELTADTDDSMFPALQPVTSREQSPPEWLPRLGNRRA